MTADHLSGLKHGVTKATRTHEGWSAAGSATVSPATAGPGAGRLLSKAACSHHRRFVRPGGRRGSVLQPVQTTLQVTPEELHPIDFGFVLLRDRRGFVRLATAPSTGSSAWSRTSAGDR